MKTSGLTVNLSKLRPNRVASFCVQFLNTSHRNDVRSVPGLKTPRQYP